MGFKIGIIDYERPSRPVGADEVCKYLSVAGKDVIRLAWSSLNPDKDNWIKQDALATWFCEFFNMKRDDGNGTRCINTLIKMDLLYQSGSHVKPEFDS